MPSKRLYLSPPHMSNKERAYIDEVFESNFIAPVGPMLEAFETDFSNHTLIPNSLAVINGTAALHLAMRVLDIGPGDEIWTASMTFIGGVSPITFCGASPVFFDCDSTSWTLDCNLLEKALEQAANSASLPKAVIATDLYGQSADYKKLKSLCSPYNIPVIADAAESLGATYEDKPSGYYADMAVYSFNGNKIITASGGGMLASHNQKWIAHARKLATQAREDAPHYEHKEIGYNYRMSNVMAAIGRGQLEVLKQRVTQKRKIFDQYVSGLSDLPGISFMPEAPYGTGNRWLSVMIIEPEIFGAGPEDLRVELEKHNIESRPTWKPMHLQPVFKDSKMHGGKVCEEIFEKGLCLPSGTQMSTNNQEMVIDIIRSFRKTGKT